MSKNSSLSHRVTSDLRRDIVAGVLEPGAWLKTEELAARYGVSANPVREALWRLQGEGFVVANPNQGARVRGVDDDFVRNIFEISRGDRADLRAPLLPAGDARRISDRLRVAAAAFADVAAERPNDFEALEAANRDFHAIIIEREFNIPAIEAMERYAGIINATRAKLPVTLSRLRQRVAQHREIVESIAAGDARGGRADRHGARPQRRRRPAQPDAAGADDRASGGEFRAPCCARRDEGDGRVRDLTATQRAAVR